MICDKKPEGQHIKLTVAEEDLKKFEDGYFGYIIDNKLIFQESPYVKEKKKKEKKENLIEKLKKPNADLKDIKEALIELLS